MTSSSHRLMLEIAIGIGLFLASVLMFSFNLDHGPYVDELYHLLSAHSVLTEGTFRVGDGEYHRAELYTRFIALLFGAFGESIEVARMSSAVTVGIFVSAVYLAMSWLLGRKEALVCALVLIAMPSTLYFAQFIRFYALHQLAFFVGVIGIYTVVTVRLSAPKLLSVSGLTLGALGLACYFQIITLIALSAVYVWVLLYLAHQALDDDHRTKLGVWLLVSLVAVGVALALALIIQGKAASLLAEFRYAAPWSAESVNDYLFYHRFLRYHFPTFWLLLPIACIVAIYDKPKPALFFACIFLISLVLFSFAGMKDERYIIFLYPFAIGIWTIFGVAMLPKIRQFIIDGAKTVPYMHATDRTRTFIANLVMLGICGFILISNHAFPITFHMLNGQQYRHEIGDWSLSSTIVAPLVKNADVVLTTNDVESLYYYGHYDFNFSKFILKEAGGATIDASVNEFVIDSRTGRPVISQPDSLEQILRCYKKGVFLGDERKWYKEGQGLGPKGVELMSKFAHQVDTDPRSRLVVYHWERETVLPEQDCEIPYQYKPKEPLNKPVAMLTYSEIMNTLSQ